mgnify:CR=1 FL=1
MCLFGFTVIFSGCSLWTLNTNKYLNQVVASYGDITVTLEETYNAYRSYGNYYYDNRGDVTFNGVEQTAKQLLNKKILVKELKNKDSSLYIKLNQTELNKVWQNVYDSFNSSILTLEKKLLSADNKSLSADIPSESSSTTTKTGYEKDYEEYTKTYTYSYNEETGKYELTKQDTTESIETSSKDVYKFTTEELGGKTLEEKLATMTTKEKATLVLNNFKEYFWDSKSHTQTNNNGEKYSEKAFNKLIANLKANETGKDLSKDSEEVFYREFTRLYGEYYDSALLTKLQNNFNKTDVISENLVLDTYRRLVIDQNTNFSKRKIVDGTLTYENYEKEMKSRTAPILSKINNDWFQVSHVLLKYDDSIVNQIKAEKAKLEKDSITLSTYLTNVTQIKNSAKFTDRATGKSYSANDVLKLMTEEISQCGTSYAKIQKFNEFIYRFNMDDGVNNAEYPYSIPTDSSKDQMVKPFADESRRLHDSGQIGAISSLIKYGYAEDDTLDSDVIEHASNYSGFHIIIYLGEFASVPDKNSATLAELNDFVLNPLNNNSTNRKTLLDYVIEQTSYSNYSAYESSLLSNLKNDGTVNIYNSVIDQIVKAFQ